MIIWQIIDEQNEWEIEIGKVTVLKGSNILWYKIVRNIDDYFNNKNSTVRIYEGTQLLPKKDWECLFIPFDAHLQLDKLNSKSPLKFLLDEVLEELSRSPAYQGLLEIWEDIRDELDFLKNKVNNYGLSLQLDPIELDQLKGFISFTTMQKIMAPLEYKILLLKLFADRIIEKKRIIIIELPELYAEAVEYKKLFDIAGLLTDRGIKVIFVTENHHISENYNYVINGSIINSARIENIRRKVINELPFVCDNHLFDEAKKYILNAVDNSTMMEGKLIFPTEQKEVFTVILFVVLKHLNIDLQVDTDGFSTNLFNFISSYK